MNTDSLSGKTVAITGSTGGLGREICSYLASLGANLILLDRNEKRSQDHKDSLIEKYGIEVSLIRLDLEDIRSAKDAADRLITSGVDIFIHNAGAYSIPRHKCETGYDNVFQINFVSPYYIIRQLMPALREREGRCVVVGSIAHNYSVIDENDIDFSNKEAASKVYGNAKRYLMFSLFELFKNEEKVTLSVTHPGITFTNITSHYPKLIFAVIKYPMKVIFMKPRKAALSVIDGVFGKAEYCEWFGPRLFDIWGYPNKKPLRTCSFEERSKIADISRSVYKKCLQTLGENTEL